MILTPEAEKFLTEWENTLPYVTARTSGSTGTPKEIRLLKSDMRASARATIEFFSLGSNSHLYLPLSPDYIAGKMQIVRAIESGADLTVVDPSSNPIDGLMTDRAIDLLPIVPPQIRGLLGSTAKVRVRNLIIGGAPMSPDEERMVIESGINAYATYGMTETCSHVALRRIGTDRFIALPRISFDTDDRGCLVINSTTLSFGTIVTNDIVTLTDGGFRWLGRFDNVINSGGIKLHPEEIERMISPLMPAGTTFYLTSRRSERWGEEMILVTDSEAVTDETLSMIRDRVGSKRTPKAVTVIPEIERTATNKIIRRKF